MAINLKTFAKDLTYQADTSVGQIFKDLKEIEEIKQLGEQKVVYFRNLVGWTWLGLVLIILIIIIAFFSIIWLFVFFNGLTTFIGLQFVILAVLLLSVLIVAAILCSVKWNYYPNLKLRDDRYELSKKVVSMVNRDRTPNSNVKIMIHFTPAGEKGKKIQTLPHPRKQGWKLDIFEDQWLTLEGKFQDSTNFFLTVKELNRTAYGPNPRGKWKSKNKPKGTEINLKLSFPSKKYGSIHVIQKAAPEAVKLPEKVNLKRMKVTPKGLELTVNTTHVFRREGLVYKTIIMMFLSLYQILNFAKMLSKRQTLS